MQSLLSSLLTDGGFFQQPDNIYSAPLPVQDSIQEEERQLREQVASHIYHNYLDTIANNHSIPVMDREVDLFLAKMPKNALILDVGGCWGWHWRRIADTRPDIGVLIIDFVRTNLIHAVNVLGSLVGTNIALMHADATALPFKTINGGVFDGVWTVQTFQHIPDYANAASEAHRVLKRGGHFVNYSLHITPLIRLIYKILGRHYHSKGTVKNTFYLSRADEKQMKIIENIFGGKVIDRYSECLFHPDLKLTFSGHPGHRLGRLDAFLSNTPFIGKWIARQRSFEAVKL